MYRRFTLSAPRRFFSAHQMLPRTEQYLQSVFASRQSLALKERDKRYYKLLEYILSDEYHKAKQRQRERSLLFELIDNLPKNATEENLDKLCRCLKEYPVKPVMTAHPTRVLSNAAITQLYRFVDAALKYDASASQIEKERMDEAFQWLLTQPIRQIRHLTPQEESQYGLFVYQKVLESFPEFLTQLSDYFIEVHGGRREEVIQKLKAALIISYQPYSWIPGDADGNYNVTAETMQQIVPARQIAILELYKNKLQQILFTVTEAHTHTLNVYTLKKKLKSTIEHFENCIQAIRVGIWFDELGSQAKILDVKKIFENEAHAVNPEIKKQLSEFLTLVEIVGFFGGMKEYVRQTTFMNQQVFNELLMILRDSTQTDLYEQLSEKEKKHFHEQITRDPAYFSKIKNHQQTLSSLAKRELERLNFILKHRDIFPFYICSDTKSKINFDEVRILIHLAAFLEGNLRLGQIKRFPINFLFLCETPEDIEHFSIIFSDILNDPWMRARAADSGFISYVSGPSDLGKTGGIVTHLTLYHAQKSAQKVLEAFKEKYPELKEVKLRVLHGYGGDMKRRIKRSGELEHATFQGLDAYDELGAPGAYAAYLHRTLGRPSVSFTRIQELQQIEKQVSGAEHVVRTLESLGVEGFKSFFATHAAKNLLMALTHPALERAMNVSSRAGSKAKATHDLSQVRAIGLVNLYLLTGIQWDIFMSVSGWVALPKEAYPQLPFLYERSSVVKDIVDKVLFALAVSDIPRAWKKIRGEEPAWNDILEWSARYQAHHDAPQNEHTLAYLETQSRAILRILIHFMPQSVHAHMLAQLEKSPVAPVHETALTLIKLIPHQPRFYEQTLKLRARYRMLMSCVDAYEKNPDTEEAVTDVVLACRATGITKGPDCIANTNSLSKIAVSTEDYDLERNLYGL